MHLLQKKWNNSWLLCCVYLFHQCVKGKPTLLYLTFGNANSENTFILTIEKVQAEYIVELALLWNDNRLKLDFDVVP